MLFTDGSVNTQSNIGYGAYLVMFAPGLSIDSLRTQVKVKRFTPTSSTKLELQTLLWAFNDSQAMGKRVIVYTDSQNIVSLPGRRSRLEGNDFRSKKGRRLNHFELYQEFYRMTDRLQCEFVKLHGHQASHKKDEVDKLFTLVDRASRSALREDRLKPG